MPEDVAQAILENLTKGDGRPPAMSELLTQLGDDDPRMGLLAKYFAQREAMATDESTPDDAEPSEHRREAVEKLQRLVERMFEELTALRERNVSLATALGACPVCWGDDLACEACGGDGYPGASVPDAVLFAHYVGPVIKLLRRRSARSASPPTSASDGPPFNSETNNHTPNNNNNHH